MNWISKAAGALKGDDSSGQTFNLFCDCGQQHQGVRRQKWQRIVCRACGGSLFVLQKDPYPPPKERREVPTSSPPPLQDEAAQSSLEERIAEDDDIPLEQDAVVKKRAAREAVARPKGLRKAVAAERSPAAEVVAAPPVVASRKSFWKPFHIVILLVVGIASLTVYGVFRNSQKSRAAIDLKESLDAIQEALNQGTWVEARNKLQTAVHAMEILDRDEKEVAPYRQKLAETTAMTGLVSQPLSELMIEADKANSKGKDALAEFQLKLHSQYLFLDGLAVRQVDPTNARVQYRMDLPLTVGKVSLPVTVILQSTVLARCLDKQESAPVILAVRIDSIEPTPQAWEIRTEPDSVVLWTSPQTYAGMGFGSEETNAAIETLKRQSDSLGVKDVARSE